jgi:Zn-finger nucleic acid-binding protein
MRKPPQRLECPACVGVAMEAASVAHDLKVHHCGRCGGTWILQAQAPRLRQVPAAALRATLARREDASFLCHDCHSSMERDAEACPSCRWSNTLECPDCGKPMRCESAQGVTVDVCRPCRAVWLDHHELDSLWAVAAAGAVAGSAVGGTLAQTGADAGGFLLEALWWAPDMVVHTAYYGAQAAGHVIGAGVEAAANAPGMLAAMPEAASGVAEMASDAAGGVFSLIAEVIAGIFEGLGG